jgi:hypothetical protein
MTINQDRLRLEKKLAEAEVRATVAKTMALRAPNNRGVLHRLREADAAVEQIRGALAQLRPRPSN